MRYVERNPVRANLIELAENWQWSSAYVRLRRADERRWLAIPADPPLPRNWRSWVNKVKTEAELTSLRRSVKRCWPFGDENWARSSAVRLGLETTTRPGGRPKTETGLLFFPLPIFLPGVQGVQQASGYRPGTLVYVHTSRGQPRSPARRAGITDNRDLTASKILANMWMHRNRRNIRLPLRPRLRQFPEQLEMPTCKDIFCHHQSLERCLT